MKQVLRSPLAGAGVPTPVKLSALWASTLCCYVYGDYFGLYVPGRLMAMNAGRMAPFGAATPAVLMGVSAMMIAPSLMVALSVLAPAPVARWLNVGLGLLYTAIMALTLPDSPPFYVMFGAVEMVLTLTAAILAWRWPREAAGRGGAS